MKAEVIQLNLLFAWVWIVLGFLSGMVLGMFFHGEQWLGGYGSLKRRMYRLGHISFFGLGAVNLLFWLTFRSIAPQDAFLEIAAWAFMLGGISMPLCCAVMAHRPKAHLIFTIPVLSLIVGGVLTVYLVSRGISSTLSSPQLLSP